MSYSQSSSKYGYQGQQIDAEYQQKNWLAGILTEDDMVFKSDVAYDEAFWNELLESPPTPCQPTLPQPSLESSPRQIQETGQGIGNYSTENPYGKDRWTKSDEDLLLEIWPKRGSKEAKQKNFVTEPKAKGLRGPFSRHLNVYNLGASLRTRDFLSHEDKVQRYNELQRNRTERALNLKYNDLVLAGEAPSLPNSQEIFSALKQTWVHTYLSPEYRAYQINERLSATYSTSYLAAKYGELIKIKPIFSLCYPSAYEDGDIPDSDGPWEPREIELLIAIWPPSKDLTTFRARVVDMMSLSGNDRSLQSMENKYRQVTGWTIYKHRELRQVQAALDAESPFSYEQRGPEAWTRVEDNALRLVSLKHADGDWSSKTTGWVRLCGHQRSSQQLQERWNMLKVQENCDPNDETGKPTLRR